MYEAHFLGRQDLAYVQAASRCVCVCVGDGGDEKACVIVNGLILAFVARPFVRK